MLAVDACRTAPLPQGVDVDSAVPSRSRHFCVAVAEVVPMLAPVSPTDGVEVIEFPDPAMDTGVAVWVKARAWKVGSPKAGSLLTWVKTELVAPPPPPPEDVAPVVNARPETRDVRTSCPEDDVPPSTRAIDVKETPAMGSTPPSTRATVIVPNPAVATAVKLGLQGPVVPVVSSHRPVVEMRVCPVSVALRPVPVSHDTTTVARMSPGTKAAVWLGVWSGGVSNWVGNTATENRLPLSILELTCG
jgi:hypothetical protein